MGAFFDYLAFFSFAFFAVLAIVLVMRLLELPTFLQKLADNQQKLLDNIHVELKEIRQQLERK
ncbi:MAG: hypothetical protein GWN21_12420 [Gammaproteobacteria bacterium]|nr:hypothetical protein [Gammaproteobacteria bacterium]NIV48390.1 hypothetical protein [Gammaproteobacteria bacterium]NIW56021.1 hypothetical protein [Gammaproteobacteria bacterium]NIX04992.1 hypothetical protein [Gammaproteobacteria bacterium]